MTNVKIWMCLTVLFIPSLKASLIRFEAFPKELKTNLSEALSMRCSVSSAASDIRHVDSIYVTRDNLTDVASVTSLDAAMALTDFNNLEVKGDISGVSDEGYLELSWRDALLVTLGDYTCSVKAVDTKGHRVTLTSDLHLGSVQPSIGDVIATFNAKLTKQQESIVHLHQDNDRLQHVVHNLTQEVNQVNDKYHKLEFCASTQVSFSAALSAGFSTTEFYKGILRVDNNRTVIYDDVLRNHGNSYDNATGVFTCSTSGLYTFSIHAISYTQWGVCLYLQHNSEYVVSLKAYDSSEYVAAFTSVELELISGDELKVVTGCTSEFHQDEDIVLSNSFSGHLVDRHACLVT